MKNLILVAEYVVVDIVLLRRLRNEHERLHEATHLLPVVRQFASHLVRACHPDLYKHNHPLEICSKVHKIDKKAELCSKTEGHNQSSGWSYTLLGRAHLKMGRVQPWEAGPTQQQMPIAIA